MTLKKILWTLPVLFLASCTIVFPTRKEKILYMEEICPHCVLYRYEGSYFALDTAVSPNKVYSVSYIGGEIRGINGNYEIVPLITPINPLNPDCVRIYKKQKDQK